METDGADAYPRLSTSAPTGAARAGVRPRYAHPHPHTLRPHHHLTAHRRHFGATGYAGSRILAEATARGHQVTAVARSVDSIPRDPAGLVTPREGSVFDAEFVRSLAEGADVLAVAIPARDTGGGGTVVDTLPGLFAAAQASGARIGFVGGAGSLRVSPDGGLLVEQPEFPEEFRVEALPAHESLQRLQREAPADVDWFYLSPAAEFGAHAPGERRGSYRLGDDVLVTDETGRSAISGEDYALAFVDEIETPRHHRARFTVAH